MSSLSDTELLEIARRVAWFKEPENVLKEPYVFLAQVMTHGTLSDVVIVKRAFGPEMFRETLDAAPPGIFDERSWSYWNLVCGRKPAPPLPQRRFE
ncbi:MAG: hypothetical protein KC800_12290 [Candidatus Eremiobacteraeota bacterium]|nr:hypothetical protein [Candidatus Eremiobacteraeota bacterium]